MDQLHIQSPKAIRRKRHHSRSGTLGSRRKRTFDRGGTMRIRALVLAGALLVSGGVQMRAQMSGPPPSPPIGTKEDPANAVDGLLSLMEMQVVGAAKAMPADKYSFAPAQAIFAPSQKTEFDTVRTFVGQVTHLAQANYFFLRLERHQARPRRQGNRLHYDEGRSGGRTRSIVRLRAQGHRDNHDRKCVCRHQADRRIQHPGDDCRFRSGPWERSLRPNGGIPADERYCAASERQVVARLRLPSGRRAFVRRYRRA